MLECLAAFAALTRCHGSSHYSELEAIPGRVGGHAAAGKLAKLIRRPKRALKSPATVTVTVTSTTMGRAILLMRMRDTTLTMSS